MSALKTQEKVNLTWEHCVRIFGFDRCIALTLHGSQNYELEIGRASCRERVFV